MAREKDLEHQGRRMRLELRTTARLEQVWQAWADPARISQWFADRAAGDVKPGGVYTWGFDGFGDFPYEVRDVMPGRRLALGGSPPGRPPLLLEVRLERDGGTTVVTLVHSGFLEGASWDDEYEGVRSGWATALQVLGQYVERHFGQPMNRLLVSVPASFAYAQLLPYYTTAAGLTAWLARTARIGGVGEPCAIVPRDGASMTGTLLAVTSREVALSWDEAGGVLELKAFAFGGGGQRVVAARVTTWGRALPGGLQAQLTAALERLAARLDRRAASPDPV